MTTECCASIPPVRTGATCCVLPSYVIVDAVERGFALSPDAAANTIATTAALLGQRELATTLFQQLNLRPAQLGLLAGPDVPRQEVYDAEHATTTPGRRVRVEGGPAVADRAVNEAYDGTDITYRFYQEIFQRDSIDGQGMQIVSSVHYSQDFDNALWNGTQMVYGDGSGVVIARGALTGAIDVIGHELTHGITQMAAGLVYRQQPGALNESFSDVFGSLVKQYARGQTAEEADWLIGDGILGTALHGRALRSMKEPGLAYDMDRQVGHMSRYVNLPADNNPRNDNGGVHINSGIPNRAFYLVAVTLGGYAWEKAGRVWYVALTERLRPNSDFRAAAQATIQVAGELFGVNSLEQRAVRAAWGVVGVQVADGPGGPAAIAPASAEPAPAERAPAREARPEPESGAEARAEAEEAPESESARRARASGRRKDGE